jgi:hypothetical protein
MNVPTAKSLSKRVIFRKVGTSEKWETSENASEKSQRLHFDGLLCEFSWQISRIFRRKGLNIFRWNRGFPCDRWNAICRKMLRFRWFPLGHFALR